MKKTLKVLSFIFAVVLLVALGCVATFAADGDAAYIGETGYATLADAIAAVPAGGSAEITLADGTHTLSGSTSGKDITITGSKGAVVEILTAIRATTIEFDGVTVKFDNDNYDGIQHSEKVVYNNCDHYGVEFLYANEVEFTGCNFFVTGDAYAVWTYGAKNVTFTDCDFSTSGKAILVYNEGTLAANISLKECNFASDGTGYNKAAVEVGQSANGNKADYVIKVEDCTADAGFSASSGGNDTGSNLIGDKNNMLAANGMAATVVEGGTTTVTYGTAAVENITSGKKYASSLNLAIADAAWGDRIVLHGDITENDITVAADKYVVIDLNDDYTVTGDFMIYGRASIYNGTIIGNDENASAIEANGQKAFLQLGNLTLTSLRHAIRVDDAASVIIYSGSYTSNSTIGTTHGLNILGHSSVYIYDGVFTGPGLGVDGDCAIAVRDTSTVFIEGGEFYNDSGNWTIGAWGGVLKIMGGTFGDAATSLVNEGGSIPTISGGTFPEELALKYYVPGYGLQDNADGTYTVVYGGRAPASAAAELNGIYYLTIAEAYAAAVDGDTITLCNDIESIGLVINKSITIDFAGNTWTITDPVGSVGAVSNGLQVLKGNTVALISSTTEKGRLAAAAQNWCIFYLVNNYADLTIDNVILDGTGLNEDGDPTDPNYTLSINNGNVTINNSQIIAGLSEGGDAAMDVYTSADYPATKTVEITNSIIDGDIVIAKADNVSEDNAALAELILGANNVINGTVIDTRVAGELGFHDYNSGATLNIEGITATLNASYENGTWTVTPNMTFTAGGKATMTFTLPAGFAADGTVVSLVHYHGNIKYVYHVTVANGQVVFENTLGFSTFTIYNSTDATIHLNPGETLIYHKADGTTHSISTPTTADGNYDDLAADYYADYDRYAFGKIWYTTLNATKVYGTDQWYNDAGVLMAGTGSYVVDTYKNTVWYSVAGDNHADHFEIAPSTRTLDAFGNSLRYENVIANGKHYLNFTILHVSATSVYTIHMDNFIIDDSGAGTIKITQSKINNNYGSYAGILPFNGAAQAGDYPVVGDFAFQPISRPGIDGPIAVKYSLTQPADLADHTLYALTAAPTVTDFSQGIITVWYIAYDTGAYVNYAPACGSYTIQISQLDITNADFALDGHTGLIYDATEKTVTILNGMVTLTVNGQTFNLYEGTDYTINGNKQTNAGDNYEVTITAVAGSNYTGTSLPRAWSIAKREVTIDVLPNSVIYYNPYVELATPWTITNTASTSDYADLNNLLTTVTDYVIGDPVGTKDIWVAYIAGKSAADHPNYTFTNFDPTNNITDYDVLTILPDTNVGDKFVAKFDKLVFNGLVQNPILNSLIVTKNIAAGETIALTDVTVAPAVEYHAGTYTIQLTIIGGNYAGAVLSAEYSIVPMPIKSVNWTIGSYTYNGLPQGPTATATAANGATMDLYTTQETIVGEYWAYVTGIKSVSDATHDLTDYALDLLSIRVASYEIAEKVPVKFTSASVVIGDSYAINFIIPADALAQHGFDAADADTILDVYYNGNEKFASAGDYELKLVGDEYILTYSQIAPSNMGKAVSVTPLFGKDPVAIDYSIAEYCYDMIEIYDSVADATTAIGRPYYDFVKMIASLLNYADAAESFATGAESALLDNVVANAGVDYAAFLAKYGIDAAELPAGGATPPPTPSTAVKYPATGIDFQPSLVFTIGSKPSITMNFTVDAAFAQTELEILFIDKTEGTTVKKVIGKVTGDQTVTFEIPLSAADHEFRIILQEKDTTNWKMSISLTIANFNTAASAEMNEKMVEFSKALATYLEWVNS